MQSKIIRYILGVFIALILLAGAFSGGILVGWAMPGQPRASLPFQLPFGKSDTASSTTAPNNEQLFKPFWQAWDIVHDEYVDQPVNDEEMMRGAIRGMMQSLGDEHSSYMDPQQFKQANAPLEGEYEGIGATVDTSKDYLTIISPYPDSPARKAGLLPGDQIIKIDDEDMTGISGDLVLRRILGPAGTQVKLTVLRKDQEPFDVTITRAKITLPSVESKMLDGKVGYVRLYTFGDKTTKDLRNALDTLLEQKPVGLILDLRNNGGGYLNTSVEVVSEFIGKGVVLNEEYGDGTRRAFNIKPGGRATEIPLIVLVNGGSASASEITAGAIQDYKRGKLVGETTFGKGSVQNWIPLDDDQGAVRVTIARWLTPEGRQINKKGLTPDVEVKLTEEDFKAGRDPQLDKAVQLLTEGK